MLTPGPNYRMSRAVKTMLARNWNNKNISVIRSSAIQGELYGRQVVKNRGPRETDTA